MQCFGKAAPSYAKQPMKRISESTKSRNENAEILLKRVKKLSTSLRLKLLESCKNCTNEGNSVSTENTKSTPPAAASSLIAFNTCKCTRILFYYSKFQIEL